MVLDPYLTECGERIRGFKRLSPMLIAPEELAVDYYVTSHLHFDHFDYDAIPIVAQCTKRTLFFGPASCQEKFIELGIQAHRCHRLDRGECYQDEKILIRAVMADHGTMAPDAIGLLVAFAGHRLYFSGDTAFHSELFQEIRIFEPDIAVLSVNGAFGNMNAEEGAAALAVAVLVMLKRPSEINSFTRCNGQWGLFFSMFYTNHFGYFVKVIRSENPFARICSKFSRENHRYRFPVPYMGTFPSLTSL